MISKNIEYFPKIDHLRFYAALLILMFHSIKSDLTKPFDIGIDLFFTLSGFIFMYIAEHVEKTILYRKFLYNRWCRVFPLVFVMFFMVIAVKRDHFQGTDIFQLFFLNMPSGTGRFGWAGNSLSIPWWTVSIEFCFYILFPFLVRFYRRYGFQYLLKLIITVILLRSLVLHTRGFEDGYGKVFMALHYSIIGHLDTFIVGMISALFFIKKEKYSWALSILSSKIFLILLICFIYFIIVKDIIPLELYGTVYGIFCSGVVLSYLSADTKIPKFLDGLLSKLGTISFSIYLSHELILDLFKALEFNQYVKNLFNQFFNIPIIYCNALYSFLIYIPCVCLFSILLYQTIEKPFLEMRVKYLE